MSSEQRGDGFTDLIARGDLSATAWFAVVDAHADRVDRAGLHWINERLTLHYPEVALLLAATTVTLFLTALGVIVL